MKTNLLPQYDDYVRLVLRDGRCLEGVVDDSSNRSLFLIISGGEGIKISRGDILTWNTI